VFLVFVLHAVLVQNFVHFFRVVQNPPKGNLGEFSVVFVFVPFKPWSFIMNHTFAAFAKRIGENKLIKMLIVKSPKGENVKKKTNQGRGAFL
jgi:hypothetical protein